MKNAIYILLLLCIPTAKAADLPPKIYIDKGACPFECCTYREWKATERLDLFDKPNGNRKVTTLSRGESVTGVTGEVHTAPTPVEVVFDHGEFRKGEKVYLPVRIQTPIAGAKSLASKRAPGGSK